MAESADPKAILQRLKSNNCPVPLVFICGPDAIRRQRASDACVRSLTQPSTQCEIRHFTATQLEGARINELRSATMNLSLFSQQRIFVLPEISSLDAQDLKPVLEIIDHAPEQTTFIVGAPTAAATHPLTKRAKQLGTLICFDKLEGQELLAWIKKELTAQGISDFEPTIPAALAQIGQESLDSIVPMVEQLALYSDGQKLKLMDLHMLFRNRGDANEFELLDALTQQKYVQAEILLQRLFELGKSPFAFVALIQKMFTTYLGVSLRMRAGQGSSIIATEMNIKPWLAQKYVTSLRSISPARLRRALRIMVRAEAKLKSKSLGAEVICSEACRLIALGPR
ncbi:MAG: DNA polymerase III subunit delta [Oligoflexia bacterium]|nr:DNA polymerase III subunit delta [Oligoflexia bacterium]